MDYLSDHRFPVQHAAAPPGDDIDFYRHVDAALGTYLRLHPAPLVLIGSERVPAAFRRISTNCTRLAGTVPGNLPTPTSAN